MLLTRMFSDKPGNAGPQAADAAHDELDLHAGLAGTVELVDHRGVDERVELGPDLRRPPGLRMRDLGVDVLKQRLAQIDRRNRQLLEMRRLGVAGDEVEHLRRVARRAPDRP